jgi:hypothetical protein
VSVSLGVCVSVFVCLLRLSLYVSVSVSGLLSLVSGPLRLCISTRSNIDFALNVIPIPPRRSLSSLLPPLFPLSFPFPQLSRPPSALPFWGSMAMTTPPNRGESVCYPPALFGPLPHHHTGCFPTEKDPMYRGMSFRGGLRVGGYQTRFKPTRFIFD